MNPNILTKIFLTRPPVFLNGRFTLWTRRMNTRPLTHGHVKYHWYFARSFQHRVKHRFFKSDAAPPIIEDSVLLVAFVFLPLGLLLYNRDHLDLSHAGTTRIRILEILPGEAKTVIEIKSHVVSLDRAPPYEALSYVWGQGRQPISCDERKIYVTENLKNALSQLRHKNHSRMMWIDALCINQSNAKERATQVKMMGFIYANAKRVVICPGLSKSTLDRASNSLRILMDFPEQETTPLGSTQKFYENSSKRVLYSALMDFFSAEWFERIWVIQEVVRSKHAIILCDETAVGWDFVEVAIETIQRNGMLYYFALMDPLAFRGLQNAALITRLRRARDVSGQCAPLFSLCKMARAFKATDPRDKVFALLGIANDVEPNEHSYLVAPDYSLSVEEVYKRLTIWQFLAKRDLAPLACTSTAGSVMDTDRRFPSWAPNFETLQPGNYLCYSRHNDSFCASADTTVDIAWTHNDNKLLCKGREVDTVEILGPAYKGFLPENESSSIRSIFEIQDSLNAGEDDVAVLARNLARAAPYYERIDYIYKVWLWLNQNNDELSNLFPNFWRLLICDRAYNGSRASIEFKSQFDFIIQEIHNSTLYYKESVSTFDSNVLLETRTTDSSLDYECAMTRWCTGRRVCITTKGRLAVVPQSTSIGDKIYVLNGGSVPFILRNRTFKRSYRVIGEAFVLGIMDGEVMKDFYLQETNIWLE